MSNKETENIGYKNREDTGKHGIPVSVVITALLAIAASAVFLHFYLKDNNTYTSLEWMTRQEAPVASQYLSAQGGYIAYNRDGAGGYNASGEMIWNISYNLKNPKAETCGSYSVFSDIGSDTACVTNGTGDNYRINVPGSIQKASISEKGTIAFLVNLGENDGIYLYNMYGELLLEINTSVQHSGFPITIALSPDGKKLVTSYLQVGEEKESRVTFYNFSDVGQNYADKMVGSFSFGEKTIPEIRFVGSERVCVFYKDGYTVYKIKEIPELLNTVVCENGIDYVVTGEDSVVIAESGRDDLVQIIRYSRDGEKKSEMSTSMPFDSIIVSKEETVLLSNSTCVIYKAGGEEKFRAKLEERIKLFLPTADSTEYIVVGETVKGKIRLVTKKEKAEKEQYD